jgi:Rod binding domain-containing protein
MDALSRAGVGAATAGALHPQTAAAATPAQAAQKFEALLLGELLKNAQRPAFGEAPLSGGSAGALYRDLFAEEIAARVSARGGLGLAAELAREVQR